MQNFPKITSIIVDSPISIPRMIKFATLFLVMLLQVWVCFAEVARTIEYPSHTIYIPSDVDNDTKHPLVIALSPGGDCKSIMELWKSVSEERKWLILASKEFQNGVDMNQVFSRLVNQLTTVFLNFPVDRSRIIVTGLSGGAMGAHAFSFLYPNLVFAVVANTGMMHEYYFEGSNKYLYPKGKLAVFLASPTDFRYSEMKRDRDFLESMNWRIKWIEFPGGHTFAPAQAYQEAAGWLEGEFKK